jgi:hypothetical protein
MSMDMDRCNASQPWNRTSHDGEQDDLRGQVLPGVFTGVPASEKPNSSNFKGFSLAERLLTGVRTVKGRWALSIITQRLYVLLRRLSQRVPFAGRKVLRGKHSTAAGIA